MKVDPPRVLAHSWLLLIHQLPAKPAYLRVKIWRRLQDIGAVAVKNAVHALPMNEETQEDFEWLLREIREGGGEAFVCEARLLDGLSDEEVRALFDRARDADYAELTKQGTGAWRKSLRRKAGGDAANELRVQVARLRKRLAEIAAIDFFGAIGRRNSGRVAHEALKLSLDKDEPVASKAKTQPNLVRDAAQPDLGNARGRLRGSNRQRLADPPLHRSRGAFQVRSGQGLPAAGGRIALRHVRGGVHPRRRQVHVRSADGAGWSQ